MKPAAPPRRYVPIEEPEPAAAPAASSASQVVSPPEPQVASAVGDDEDELDGIITRRWAVND